MRTTWLAGLLALATTAPASADAVVTACQSDVQADAGVNFAQALATGGVIRFACPAGSNLRVTGRYVLSGSTLIEGGGMVTLDGHGSAGPVLRAATATNTILRGLTLRGFVQPPRPGIGRVAGAVLATSGDAELDHVTVEGSEFPFTIGGTATVSDSAFVGNQSSALSLATAHVVRSRFTGNGSGLSMSAGWVHSCVFTGQTDYAIRVVADGPVEIRHSNFSSSRGGPALTLSQRAGRGGPQTVVVRANSFRDNDGGSGAGAIALFDLVAEARGFGLSAAVLNSLGTLPPARFVLAYNLFDGNHGVRGGAIAADLANTGGMTSIGDLFVSNFALGDGAAVAVTGGTLRMSHALFRGNRAGGRGAAVSVAADGALLLDNALAIGNAGPAGTVAGDQLTLANVTIADNAAAGLLVEGAAARVGNTLFARNQPADCAGLPLAAAIGGNLQSDGSCAGVPTGEAFLDSFYVPALGSPALRAGDPVLCRGTEVGGFDLPFQSRLDPTACALGAFEHAPVRNFAGKTDRQVPHAEATDDFSDSDGYQPPAERPGASSTPPGSSSPARPIPGSTEPASPTEGTGPPR